MKNDEKFETLYNEIIADHLDEMKDLKEKADIETGKRNIKIGIAVTAFLGIFIFMFMYPTFIHKTLPNVTSLTPLIITSVIVIIVLIVTSSSKDTEAYINTYKEKVIGKLIASFNNNLKIIPKGYISEETYNDAELERYDRYLSEDLIAGQIQEGLIFNMGEVHTWEEKTDDEGHTTYTTIFHGLFSKIETPKPFQTKVYLRMNRNIFRTELFSRIKTPKLELDSKEFEKYFDVYTDNKIIAMQLLTADIMEMLINFIKDNNIKYEITLKENKLYIRYRTGAMFETGKKLLDKDILYKYFKILDFTFTLTEKLIKLIKETEY